MRRLALLLAFVWTLGPPPGAAQTSYVFPIDTTASSVTVSVTARPPLFAAQADSSVSRLSGEVALVLTPGTAPFSEIQVTAADVVLVDGLSFAYDYGLAGTLDITAEPDSITLTLAEPGDAALIADDAFLQTGNTFAVSGRLALDASGGLSLLGLPPSADLASTLVTDIGGTLTADDDTLRLRAPLLITGTDTLSGVPIDLRISGVVVGAGVQVATGTERAAPAEAALEPGAPNPFSTSTRLTYTLAEPGPVRLSVFDALGREVAVLVDALQAAGRHEATFGAHDAPSGLYLVRLEAGPHAFHRTVVLVR